MSDGQSSSIYGRRNQGRVQAGKGSLEIIRGADRVHGGKRTRSKNGSKNSNNNGVASIPVLQDRNQPDDEVQRAASSAERNGLLSHMQLEASSPEGTDVPADGPLTAARKKSTSTWFSEDEQNIIKNIYYTPGAGDEASGMISPPGLRLLMNKFRLTRVPEDWQVLALQLYGGSAVRPKFLIDCVLGSLAPSLPILLRSTKPFRLSFSATMGLST